MLPPILLPFVYTHTKCKICSQFKVEAKDYHHLLRSIEHHSIVFTKNSLALEQRCIFDWRGAVLLCDLIARPCRGARAVLFVHTEHTYNRTDCMEVSKILYCPLPFFFPDQFYVDEITIALFPLVANAMRVIPPLKKQEDYSLGTIFRSRCIKLLAALIIKCRYL